MNDVLAFFLRIPFNSVFTSNYILRWCPISSYIDRYNSFYTIYTLICCILCRKLALYDDDGLHRTRKKKEDCEMRPHSGNIAAQFRKLRLVLLLRSLSSHVQCPFLA